MKINPADKKVKSRVKKVDDGAVVTSHRPLRGRNVFLHLLGWRGAEKFEENLKLLGASIEKCFSREVNVLITNQGIIKDYERPHSKVVSVSGASPTTPSPFNLASIKSIDSPQPESPGDAASRKPLTRGQSIALRATRNAGSGDVIENAKRWKIRIIHIDQAQKYVQREIEKIPRCDGKRSQGRKNSKDSSSKHKVKRLQGNFIKFEASNRQFRPVTKSFTSFPSINASTPFGSCPFDQPKKVHGSVPIELGTERAEREEHDKDGGDVGNAALRELEQCDELNLAEIGSPPDDIKGRTRHGSKEKHNQHGKADLKNRPSSCKLEKMAKPVKSYSKGELRCLMLDKVKAELKCGYCETCEIKYDDIDKHITTEQHKRFARQSSNYSSLDELIQQGPNMEQFLNDVLKYQELHKREAQKTDSGGENAEVLTPLASRRCTLRPRHCRSPMRGHQSCKAKSSQYTDGLSSEIRSASQSKSPQKRSLRRNLLQDTIQNQNSLPKPNAMSPREKLTLKQPLAQSLDVKTKDNSTSLVSSHRCGRLPRAVTIQQHVKVRRSARLLNFEQRTHVKYIDSSSLISPDESMNSPLARHHNKQITVGTNDKEEQSPGKHCSPSQQCHSAFDKKNSSPAFSMPPECEVDNLDLSPWNRIPATNLVLLSPRVFVTPLKDADVSHPIQEASQNMTVDAAVSPSTLDQIVRKKSILRKPGVKSSLRKVIFHQSDIADEGSKPLLMDMGDTDTFIEGITRLTSDLSPCTKHTPETVSLEDSVQGSAIVCRSTQRSEVLTHDPLSPSKVTSTQSPLKTTLWECSNIADSKQSPRTLCSGESGLNVAAKLSAKELTDEQSLEVETDNELPPRITTRQMAAKQTTAKEMPTKQAPQKRTVRQTPTKQTTAKQLPAKQFPAKQTPTKQTPTKQTPTKQTPTKQATWKRTVKQTPTKQTPTKQTPTKQTPTKQTPTKQTPTKQTPTKQTPIRQTPAKQTPAKQAPTKQATQKRTVRQTPTKQTPTKQTPTKQTPTKQTPTKQTPTKQTPTKQISIRQTPAKQTPTKQATQKRTVRQTPTKQTPAKQTMTKQTPVRQTPTKQTPQKRIINQTPTKQTPTKEAPQKKTIRQTPTKETPIKQTSTKEIPQTVTLRKTPTKQTPAKQTPQKQTPRQTPTKQTPAKQMLSKVGRRLTWKWGNDESPQNVCTRKSALSKPSITPQKSPQKLDYKESLLDEPILKEEGLQDVDNSRLYDCEAEKMMKSGISNDVGDDDADDNIKCSGQKWIIQDDLDTSDTGMIGETRGEFVGSSFEFVPASDNTTDGQQTAIQLPPVNVLEKFCTDQGADCTGSSPIYIALHDSQYKDSDKSEGWDSQVESFLNFVLETKVSASPGISLHAAQTVKAPVAGQGERSPLCQLDGLAAPGKETSISQAAGLSTPTSGWYGKGGAESNVMSCSPLKRSAVGEPICCSTPSMSEIMVDENADGGIQQTKEKQLLELPLKAGDVPVKPSPDKQSLCSQKKKEVRPLKSRCPSPRLGQKGHNKFDYLQLSKRFSTCAPILVPKCTSNEKKGQSSSAKKDIKKSTRSNQTPGCQMASGSTNSCSSFSLPGKSCSNDGQNYTSSFVMAASSEEGAEPRDSHVVPKLTLAKKVALFAAKAKSNLDNSSHSPPKHAMKSKYSGSKPAVKRLLVTKHNPPNKRRCRRDIRLCSINTDHAVD